MITATLSANEPMKRIPGRIHSLALAATWTAAPVIVVGFAAWGTRHAPAWMTMWAIAAGQFFLLKLANLGGHWRSASKWRIAAFLLLWPGMNAGRFLRKEERGEEPPHVPRSEWLFAFAKLGFGLALATWATVHAETAAPLLVAWVGMLGIIFTLHFGLFHVASCAWRRSGIDAPPIMRSPIAARSLAEFWGERWNIAFAESARRFLLRPLARRWGVGRAGAFVFLVSGIVHETVVSLPARGGWGGPTLYFLLQAGGAALEKNALGRRIGLGAEARGRAWTLAVTALPLPLLFHAPFAERVIVPLFRFLQEAL
jgi:alginate O-acetyltransferase complex protein AlgI